MIQYMACTCACAECNRGAGPLCCTNHADVLTRKFCGAYGVTSNSAIRLANDASLLKDGEGIKVTTGPALIDGDKPIPAHYPPDLGEHNQEVWGALGLSPEDIAALQEEGIL